MDLLCDDCPRIHFQADAARLRESIREFGQVNSATTSPMTPKMFSPLDPFPPTHLGQAASLPKAFEEYEDDDSHLMHKTVNSGPHTSVS
jgi:hypothetical protein